MLAKNDYDYFKELIESVIYKIENKVDKISKSSSIGFWNTSSHWCSPVDAINVTFYNINHNSTSPVYEIDIWENVIMINNIEGYEDTHKLFSTEYVADNSDEAFFQLSLIQDVSVFDTEFLRLMIKLSLLLRENYNAQSK